MFPTPEYEADYDRTYEPSEDTFVFLDTLEQEKGYLQSRFDQKLPLCVEIGTGTGLVTTFLRKHILENLGIFLATDVNKFACETCARTDSLNKLPREFSSVDTIQCDLTSAVASKIDLLMFNPPYVPSEHLPQLSQSAETTPESVLLDMALCGGKDGMEVTSRVLESLTRVLSHEGVAYILFCASNKPETVAREFVANNPDWDVTRVFFRKAGREELCIMRFTRHTV